MNFIDIKNVFSGKDPMKCQRQATDLGKIFANHSRYSYSHLEVTSEFNTKHKIIELEVSRRQAQMETRKSI